MQYLKEKLLMMFPSIISFIRESLFLQTYAIFSYAFCYVHCYIPNKMFLLSMWSCTMMKVLIYEYSTSCIACVDIS